MNRVNKTNENRRNIEKKRDILIKIERIKKYEIKQRNKNQINGDGRENFRKFFVNLFN